MNGFKVVCGFFTGIVVCSMVIRVVKHDEIEQRVNAQLNKDNEK